MYIAIQHANGNNNVDFIEAVQWSTFLATSQGDIHKGIASGTNVLPQSTGIRWLSIVYVLIATSFYLSAIIIGVRQLQPTIHR